MEGIAVLKRLREWSQAPVLVLTVRDREADKVAALDAGADDYLTKPFNAHELRVRLRAGRRILDLQEELLRAREALRDQATHDSLTGLWNRGFILETLRNEVARAARESQPVAVLIADLDHFKQVNDTHGHIAGDAVLREAAHRMKATVRRYDAVGRYGGEEFLVVLPGCDLEDACAQAERLREAVGAGPVHAAGTDIPVTCSIGVSCRSLPSAADVDFLVREADLALYTAKDSGRNRVVRS